MRVPPGLAKLAKYNERDDQRHVRHALIHAELIHLLAVTEASELEMIYRGN